MAWDRQQLIEEIEGLRHEVARLRSALSHCETRCVVSTVAATEDDGAEAEADRAFAEFYGAYDEVHAKTRKFLLD